MVRLFLARSLVNDKNRYLLRLPIHSTINKNYVSSSLANYSTIAKVCAQYKCAHHLRQNGQKWNVNSICSREFSSISDKSTYVKLKESLRPQIKRKAGKTIRTKITEVTTSSSSQKQHSVQVFGRKQLSRFVSAATATNGSQGMFNIKEKPVLFFPDEYQFDLEKNGALLEEMAKSLAKFLNATEFEPNVHEQIDLQAPELLPSSVSTKEEKAPITQTSDVELQKKFELSSEEYGRQEALEQSIKAYLNACIDVDMVERAFAVLIAYRRRSEKTSLKINLNDPSLFEVLLTKFASMKNWSRVCNILSEMEKGKIKYTPQVYMTIFDCLGRMAMSGDKFDESLIVKYIEKAGKEEISLNDIMDKSIFVNDQRSNVLKAIRRIRRDFVPVYTPPQLTYSNDLLASLNDFIDPISKIPHKSNDTVPGSEISNAKYGFGTTELENFSNEQFDIETQGRITVINVAMQNIAGNESKKVLENRKKVDKLFEQWHAETIKAIKSKLNVFQHKMRTGSVKKINLYPYLRLLTPEELADILMDELKCLGQASESYTSTVVQMYASVGEKVQRKYQVKVLAKNGVTEKVEQLYATYRDILSSGTCTDNPRQLWQRIVHHARNIGPDIDQPPIYWPWPVHCDIGRTLFKILFENIKIDANMFNAKTKNEVPVLYSLFRSRDLMSREEVRPHPVFAKLYRDAKIDTLSFPSNQIPMMCPSIPWTSTSYGGYLISKSELIRLPYKFSYHSNLLNEAPKAQIYPPLDALNQLGSIAWRINTRILDLAIKLFNVGGDEKFHVPLTPDSMLTDEHLKYRGITHAEYKEQIKSSNAAYTKRQNELNSLYCEALYKLSLANHFRDRKFWMPHNMDFRGRVYPISPHLTHLSSDLTRSMLCFSQKQPLGEFGLDWLKLHCINLTGMKKRDSVTDRLQYADEILDDIIDSADNPIDGRQWWLKSDEPWQTLAACVEIADAIRSGDPPNYMSSFPIHQDGSCNGLQHYAALGRDIDGAASVNLSKSEVPQDVYSTVANYVEKFRSRDALSGNTIAIELDGLIKRKIIKQTVMTTVYGVTAYGARLQIEKQLKNINFPSKSINAASGYLQKQTFLALTEMFSAAREIQDWLTECAKFISKDHAQHVEWISPLGLPVVQPYTRKSKRTQTNVSLTSSDFKRNDAVVNTVKEKNAFPPNFIHSLDSCHMMLTSLNCEKSGLTFVSVHDCFWTHAGTVQIMNRICREQFVLLHSQPILESLAESFYQKYEVELNDDESVHRRKKKRTVSKQDNIFMMVPKKGDFDLNNVLESVYFFS